jgi:uncharacterized OB-fold protein
MGAYLSVPSWMRQTDSRYRLVLGQCPDCGAYTFPPEGACVDCGGTAEFDRVEPDGTGTVVARTIVEGGPPPEFERFLDVHGAIGVVIVELDEGARVPGMLTDCDPYDVARGERVTAVVRRIYDQEGIVRYGAKFRPLK